MGVDIFSRKVTLSGCSSECKSWSNENVSTNYSSSVKRSLFGPVDHQEAMSFCNKELAKMEQEKMLKWNFDFANEKPLQGNFQWQKIDDRKSYKLLRSPLSKVTKFKSKKSPLKSRVNRDNVDVRNKQTTITGELISLLITRNDYV